MEDDEIERKYNISPDLGKAMDRVRIVIDKNIANAPLLKEFLLQQASFKNFDGGRQGTNFKATKEQYETILNMIEQKPQIHYWIYAPGRNAKFWDEFYNKGIMCVGDDKLGDTSKYASRELIEKRLKELEKTNKGKWNDALMHYNFSRVMKSGDIVIAKRGRTEFLGYGVVTSGYYFDETRELYKHSRKIEWKNKFSIKETENSIVLKTLTDVTKYTEYVNRLIKLLNINTLDNPQSQPPLNLILYGPPGTGKTYHTVNEALKIIDPAFNLDQDRHLVKQEYDRLVKEGRIVFTTFHQSMSYEDFVEGIKPVTLDTQKLGYEIEPGLFKQLAALAMDNWLSAQTTDKEQLSFDIAFTRLQEEWEEKPDMKFSMKRAGNDFTILGFNKTSIRFKKASGGTNHTLSIATLAEYYYKKREIEPSGLGIYYPGILEKLNSYKPSSFVEKFVKPFVLIIDEINRGNVSQIFGELITLIEPDKRAGMEEALEAVLPYSKEKFSVPPNLFIIGTMNTADRSVEALDTALRRRFTFREMMPDVSVQGIEQVIDGISLKALLNTLNRRIELLLDRDHQIGHSFLMKVKDLNELMQVFYHQIIPLLKEYFYGDFGKIGLVLEEGFVTADSGRKVFGKFNYDDRGLLEEKKRYSITDYSTGYTPDIEGFKDALLKLLNGNTEE